MSGVFDETLYLQCREYIKLYLLNEELSLFVDYEDMKLKLPEVVDSNDLKASILLKEIYNSLMRLK